MKSTFTALLFVLMAGVSAHPISFQSEEKPKPAPRPTPAISLASLHRDFRNSLPIPAGEKLEYEIRYARFPVYATVGTITFEYLGEALGNAAVNKIDKLNLQFAPAADERLLHFRVSAVSKGFLISILGADVNDRIETLVDARDFSARLGFKEIKEGKKHQAQALLFDRAGQTIKFTVDDLNNASAPAREKAASRLNGSLDLLSAIYFVRLQKLKEGQLIQFPINDDGVNYPFSVVVGKHEKLKTDCGKVKTIRLEPKIFGAGQLISRPGEMTMWVTDDNKHIPLRVSAKTSSGNVSAKLLNYKNHCQLIEPQGEPPAR